MPSVRVVRVEPPFLEASSNSTQQAASSELARNGRIICHLLRSDAAQIFADVH